MSARWSSAARLTAWAWFAALLGAVSLGPLVESRSFLVVGAFLGALVAATGAVGRLAHVPAALIVLAQLVVLLEWVTVTYAGAEAYAAVVPTPESVRALVDLVRAAVETSNTHVPPAPLEEGLGACLAVSVALVVLVVDLVAVTWRRPALVGLVFLGLYMAPVSLLGDVPVVAFVPGALGYVFLLAAEQRDRLSHWGRQITHAGTLLAGREGSPTVTSLASAGRRVGFGAVALAVVLPVLLPTLPRTFLADGPLTADGAGGDGSVDVDNPMLDLRRNLGEQSNEVLVEVTTDDPDPSYLRIAALDEFEDDSWQPGPRPEDTALPSTESPAVPGLGAGALDVNRYQVQITDQFSSSWLPTTYALTRIQQLGEQDDWTIDPVHLDVPGAAEASTDGLTYEYTSQVARPSRDELLEGGPLPPELLPYTQLPDDLPASIEQTAADVTAGIDAPIDQALALQAWFRDPDQFSYSIEAGEGDGLETIDAFLTGGRVGYCEQFAAAMALQARTLGIPARVAVGFLRPDAVAGADDRFQYRGDDMHAWPELYIVGAGWLRFEPTPGGPGYSPVLYRNPAGGPGGAGDDPSAPPTSIREPQRPELTGDPAAVTPGGAGSDGTDLTLLWWGLGVLCVIVLASAPRGVRAAVRRRRWSRVADGDVEPAWRELRDGTVDLGLRFDDRATLRGAGRGLRPWLTRPGAGPAAVEALNRLVVTVERSRFARAEGATRRAATDGVRGDVEAVLETLAAGRSRTRLARAGWLPASLLPGRWRPGARSGEPVVSYGRDGGVVQVEGTATR